jgi:NADPH-dependent glutamate synthase beta subunit-like oxidoreductase
MFFKEPIENPPCKLTCPAGIDVPRYIRAIAKRDFNEALAVIRESIPFPSVCGRICFHPCESVCRGNLLDGGPIAINALKRFVSEGPTAIFKESQPYKSTGKSIAIIGSGPAGLTAAYYLARKGHVVIVFEAQSEPGGMMRYGIPDYRLPKDLLSKEINYIKSMGVEIKTDTKIDSLDNLFKEGYHAVLLAIGAWKSKKLEIEGEDFAVDCISFLKDINEGKKVELNKKVVIIGGGNAAVDTARSVLRLGINEVIIIYRRSREEMPVNPMEVEHALLEGINIEYLATPLRISKVNERLKVDCIHMTLRGVDEKGRRIPVPIPGTNFSIEADMVISAIGQMPDIISGEFGVWTNDDGLILVKANTLAIERPGVFAGGDAVTGPASVIEAIAAGKKAAASIDRHLGGNGNIFKSFIPTSTEILQIELQGFPIGDHAAMPTLPLEERIRGFSPVELGFDEEIAVKEAGRCLRCDLPIIVAPEKCVGCLTCMLRCSLRHDHGYMFSPRASKIKVTPIIENVNEILFDGECDTCGICARYCPYGAIFRRIECRRSSNRVE